MLHYNQSKPKFLHTIRTNFFHCSDEDKLQMLVETLGEPIDNNTVRTANIIKKQLPNGQAVYAIYFNYSNYVMYPRFSIWAQSDVKSLPLTLIRRFTTLTASTSKAIKRPTLITITAFITRLVNVCLTVLMLTTLKVLLGAILKKKCLSLFPD